MGSQNRPKISVILPSFNGADTLERTLSELRSLAIPPGGAEFILVDNGSTDGTIELMRSASGSLGACVICEARRGKSFALNTGIAAAKGELLLFLDDDVLPAQECLLHYVAAAERHPKAGVFAGQIRPAWTGTPPAWLQYLTDVGRSWGCTPVGMSEQELAFHQIKGANLMVRRAALGGLRFDVDRLNFTATRRQGGSEDTALAKEISTLGHAIVYLPSACVYHIIQPSEMTIGAVFRRYMRIGMSVAYRDYEPSPVSRKQTALATTLRYRAKAGRKLASAAIKVARGRTCDAAEAMLVAAKYLGQAQALDELRMQRQAAPVPLPQVGSMQTERNI